MSSFVWTSGWGLGITRISSRQRSRATSSSGGPTPASKGSSTEPVTPIPQVFSHSLGSQFHYTVAPPTEGFFVEVFQSYSSMMIGSSNAPR
ncbi:hypothetical protein V6N13_046365 [Hibiscus sabdariffa]